MKGRSNYDEWKRAAKSNLTIKDLWEVIEDNIPPIISPTTNALAISEITLMIEPTLYNYIKETKWARKVWDDLAKVFDDSGDSRKVTILSILVSIKLMDFDTVENFVNEILLYWQKSKVAGFQIEEQVIASLMLGELPEEYRTLILGIENSGKELTVDFVKTVLFHWIPDLKAKNSENKAMVVRDIGVINFSRKKRKGYKG